MLNKLKLVAITAAVVVGMVVYKVRFDAKEAADKAERRRHCEDDDGLRWN